MIQNRIVKMCRTLSILLMNFIKTTNRYDKDDSRMRSVASLKNKCDSLKKDMPIICQFGLKACGNAITIFNNVIIEANKFIVRSAIKLNS